ncbi:hypothetical protein OUZ56_011897 [Daphnia magna]|uniref:Uncharacterized protein n=1 Tax=Daphnia magna TaxID=35525 RepID=A0ABQ9Z1F7_9CRUS|nr:hypothetical protein OUZ56_011897 [Daphnia magna]
MLVLVCSTQTGSNSSKTDIHGRNSGPSHQQLGSASSSKMDLVAVSAGFSRPGMKRHKSGSVKGGIQLYFRDQNGLFWGELSGRSALSDHYVSVDVHMAERQRGTSTAFNWLRGRTNSPTTLCFRHQLDQTTGGPARPILEA